MSLMIVRKESDNAHQDVVNEKVLLTQTSRTRASKLFYLHWALREASTAWL